jgi:multiple sugar transport system substrate-binding protein
MKKKKITLILAIALSLLIAGSFFVFFAGKGEDGDKKAKDEGPITLRILYFQWAPGNAVAKTAALYEAATGGKVKVETELPGFVEWQTKWLASIAAQEYVWDIIVIDSQWLGQAVDGGHIIELTDLVGDKPFTKKIPPLMQEYYMGDPTNQGKIWSVPLEADAQILIYRTDLLEDDPGEAAAFKAKYGYDLGAPKTWFQLRDIAEHFTRPDENLYGYAAKWGIPYDVITWDFAEILWGFGGAFWDRETRQVEGILNTPEAVEALTFYKSLTEFAPPGWANFTFDHTIQVMSQGIVSMIVEWSSFAPSLQDPENSKVHDRIAFTIPPAGPKAHYASMGGQPMTISAYSPYQKEAADFIEWFYEEEQMWTFAENWGHPANLDILSSQRFWDILPQNKTMYEVLPYVRDVWNIPPYPEMLIASEELLNAAVTGDMEIDKALNRLAGIHQRMINEFYGL